MDSRIDPRPEENMVYAKYIHTQERKASLCCNFGLDAFRIVVLLKKCRLE